MKEVGLVQEVHDGDREVVWPGYRRQPQGLGMRWAFPSELTGNEGTLFFTDTGGQAIAVPVKLQRYVDGEAFGSAVDGFIFDAGETIEIDWSAREEWPRNEVRIYRDGSLVRTTRLFDQEPFRAAARAVVEGNYPDMIGAIARGEIEVSDLPPLPDFVAPVLEFPDADDVFGPVELPERRLMRKTGEDEFGSTPGSDFEFIEYDTNGQFVAAADRAARQRRDIEAALAARPWWKRLWYTITGRK